MKLSLQNVKELKTSLESLDLKSIQESIDKISAEAEAQGHETFEDANDFDIPDEEEMPLSGYEQHLMEDENPANVDKTTKNVDNTTKYDDKYVEYLQNLSEESDNDSTDVENNPGEARKTVHFTAEQIKWIKENKDFF